MGTFASPAKWSECDQLVMGTVARSQVHRSGQNNGDFFKSVSARRSEVPSRRSNPAKRSELWGLLRIQPSGQNAINMPSCNGDCRKVASPSKRSELPGYGDFRKSSGRNYGDLCRSSQVVRTRSTSNGDCRKVLEAPSCRSDVPGTACESRSLYHGPEAAPVRPPSVISFHFISSPLKIPVWSATEITEFNTGR